MQPDAWIFMLTAWGIVIVMTILSFRKLLASPTALRTDEELPADRPEPWGAPPSIHEE